MNDKSEVQRTFFKHLFFCFISGYVTTSEKGSYRDDCLSLNSVDSGCICRCSTYSSDSSQHPYSAGTVEIPPSSKPITIPGAGAKTRYNRSSSGSFSKRFSTGSTHSYAIISDTATAIGGNSVQRKRCSSCNSTRAYFILERENSTASPSPSLAAGGDYSHSISPLESSPNLRGMNRLKKAFSTLKLDSNKKHASGSSSINTTAKTLSHVHSMGERRRSLPDLVNPRKSDIIRRTRRSLKAMKRHVSMSEEGKRQSRSVERCPPPTSGSKFYLQTSESSVSSPHTVNGNAQMTSPLYDLVPSRDETDNRILDHRHLDKKGSYNLDEKDNDALTALNTNDEQDFDTCLYMTPLSTSVPKDSGYYQQPIFPTSTNDIYGRYLIQLTRNLYLVSHKSYLDPFVQEKNSVQKFITLEVTFMFTKYYNSITHASN